MHALIEGKGKLDVKAIVKYYGKWFQDGPFDIGMTTASALKHADPSDPNPTKVRSAAFLGNMNSLSNGSLMRATPIAVWSQHLTSDELE